MTIKTTREDLTFEITEVGTDGMLLVSASTEAIGYYRTLKCALNAAKKVAAFRNAEILKED